MDEQLKKGLLEICVLASLSQQESYGYIIITDVSKVLEISDVALYSVLKRLENGLLLTTYNQEYNGRNRKYYKITDKGKKRLSEYIVDLEGVKDVISYIHQKIEQANCDEL